MERWLHNSRRPAAAIGVVNDQLLIDLFGLLDWYSIRERKEIERRNRERVNKKKPRENSLFYFMYRAELPWVLYEVRWRNPRVSNNNISSIIRLSPSSQTGNKLWWMSFEEWERLRLFVDLHYSACCFYNRTFLLDSRIGVRLRGRAQDKREMRQGRPLNLSSF
jgi:hypothetical protein